MVFALIDNLPLVLLAEGGLFLALAFGVKVARRSAESGR
jgi:hypothetical protein